MKKYFILKYVVTSQFCAGQFDGVNQALTVSGLEKANKMFNRI
jgi:hypothetical protein